MHPHGPERDASSAMPKPRQSPAAERDLCLHAPSPEVTAALQALLAAFRSLTYASLPSDAIDGAIEPGELPEIVLRSMALEARGRELARLLLYRAIDASRVSSAELAMVRDDVEGRTRQIAGSAHGGPPPISPAEDDVALVAAAELLREIGLEELDRSVNLVTEATGAHALVSHPVPSETAHVWLSGRLYDRVEAFVATDPLLTVERAASAWWFDQWSAVTRRPSQEEQFSREVREQEWSFVERETVTLGAPVMTAICEQPFFDHVPPKQQRLARALRRSFPGLFEVRSTRDYTTVLEGLLDGREYVIHEHNQPVMYHSGFLGLGRLIPFEQGGYLRSPGMLFLLPPDASTGTLLTAAIERGRGELDLAILIESLISVIAWQTRVPRAVSPASSAKEAGRVLEALRVALDAAGLRQPALLDEVPENVREMAQRDGAQLFSYPIDDVLGAWIAALDEQSGGRRSGAGGRGRRERSKGSRRKRGRGSG
jgi:hypothetical protein